MESSSNNAKSSLRSEAFKEASDGNPKSSFKVLCKFLREEGAQPIDARGNTILHFMAMYGNLPAFEKLLRDGNEILTHEELTRGNKKGDTALHEAAKFGQREVAQVLLEKERDLALARNESGETPLFVAAACGKQQVFDLLKAGIQNSDDDDDDDSVMTRNDGSTVLHAVASGSVLLWNNCSRPKSIIFSNVKIMFISDSDFRASGDLLLYQRNQLQLQFQLQAL